MYVAIAPSSFADQSCKATDLFPASRWGHVQTSPLLVNQRQVARFTRRQKKSRILGEQILSGTDAFFRAD
jgi:hypothetical protein